MTQSAAYRRNANSSFHEISVKFRLPARFNGNPAITRVVRVMNDTGSDVQTIFDTDLAALKYNRRTYTGFLGVKALATPIGTAMREFIKIEMQIVKSDGTPLTPWFDEIAVITPSKGAMYRHSGSAMREHLYFATAPGNTTLYVAKNKEGIVRQLPAGKFTRPTGKK